MDIIKDLINVDLHEVGELPDEINISTMSASCKLNSKINITDIENYLELNSDSILTKKMNNDNVISLLDINKKKNLKKMSFYNQITIVVRISSGPSENLNLEPKINMKLFKNGSIQMSGCKSAKNINIALNKVLYELNNFVENPNNLIITDFKIYMINSNYKVDMQINRDKLYNLLIKKRIRAIYDPCIKASIIIKYYPQNNMNIKGVSIFIFQKGNIIITGGKSRDDIISSYNYINDIIYNHKDDIIKTNIDIYEVKKKDKPKKIPPTPKKILKNIKNNELLNNDELEKNNNSLNTLNLEKNDNSLNTDLEKNDNSLITKKFEKKKKK